MHKRIYCLIPIVLVMFLYGALNIHWHASFLHAQEQVPPGVVEGFERLEQILLTEPSYRIDFMVHAEGALNIHLEGTLHIRGEKNISISADGVFGSERVSLRFSSDGTIMEGGSRRHTFSREVPEYLHYAVVLGFTRMGILNNLFRLAEGEPPEFAESDIRDIVKPRDLTAGERRFITDNIEGFPFGFRITVDDRSVGWARLWMNAHNFLPLRREQTVYINEGEINVTELYTFQQ